MILLIHYNETPEESISLLKIATKLIENHIIHCRSKLGNPILI